MEVQQAPPLIIIKPQYYNSDRNPPTDRMELAYYVRPKGDRILRFYVDSRKAQCCYSMGLIPLQSINKYIFNLRDAYFSQLRTLTVDIGK